MSELTALVATNRNLRKYGKVTRKVRVDTSCVSGFGRCRVWKWWEWEPEAGTEMGTELPRYSVLTISHRVVVSVGRTKLHSSEAITVGFGAIKLAPSKVVVGW